MITLYEISARYQQAFLALADSDLPEDCINDTLEGLEGGFSEKGRAVAAFSLNMQAEIDAMKNAEKRIADRRKAMEAKRDRLEKYLAKIWRLAALRKSKRMTALSGPSYTLAVIAPL